MTRYVAKPLQESPLIEFLLAWFHEDWRLDDADPPAVVLRYKTASSPQELTELVADIDVVLSEYAEDAELREMISRHLINVDRGDEPPDGWLRWLRGRLGMEWLDQTTLSERLRESDNPVARAAARALDQDPRAGFEFGRASADHLLRIYEIRLRHLENIGLGFDGGAEFLVALARQRGADLAGTWTADPDRLYLIFMDEQLGKVIGCVAVAHAHPVQGWPHHASEWNPEAAGGQDGA